MIFYNENMSSDMTKIIIDNEKLELANYLNMFNSQKSSLLIYMKKITDSIQLIEYADNTQILLDLLSELKKILDEISHLKYKFTQLSNELTDLTNNISNLSINIEKYNINLTKFKEEILAFFSESEIFIKKLLENFELTFLSSKFLKEIPQDDKCDESATPSSANNIPEPNKNVPKTSLKDNNCLTISEQENKVFLPYKLNELTEQLSVSPYSSIEELIENEYILPLEQFKNPVISRFKETFNLMRNKENSSFLEALDLALELSFNSTLNPAVIAACKNQDELDIYLDCLENNELDKFTIFKIDYKISPL